MKKLSNSSSEIGQSVVSGDACSDVELVLCYIGVTDVTFHVHDICC